MRGYDRARRLLTDHRRAASALAERLLVAESLDAAEIKVLLVANGLLGEQAERPAAVA